MRRIDWPFTPGSWPERPICGHERPDGGTCQRTAGRRTWHPNRGHCGRHGGLTQWRWKSKGLSEVHELAREMNISPWQGLLLAVRRSAGEAAWYDSKIAETTNDDDLRPGGASYDWLLGSRQALDKLARYSKMAVDAGVAERMVQQMELEGQTIALVLLRTLSALGLTGEQEEAARAILRRELLAIESSYATANVVDGEVTQ